MEYAGTQFGRPSQQKRGRPSFLEVIAHESTNSLLGPFITYLLEVLCNVLPCKLYDLF